MRKKFSLLLVLVLLAGVVGLARTTAEPRAVGSGVWLFDNKTGGAITELRILFHPAVTLESISVIAFGGGEAVVEVNKAGPYSLVTIEVELVASGTLQVTLSGDSADARVVGAYW